MATAQWANEPATINPLRGPTEPLGRGREGWSAMSAPLSINYTSGVPIYVQIKDELKHAILNGSYPLGTQLPTVRQLAVDLRINANTVGRAYAELEREGLLSTQRGRGTFVTLEKTLDDSRFAELEERLRTVVEEALRTGFTVAEVEAVIHTILQEKGRPA